MSDNRINTRLSGPLYEHVKRVSGPDGLYETPSEYVRDLIRQDMRKNAPTGPHDDPDMPPHGDLKEHIRQGFEDFAEGRFIVGTGDLWKDMALAREKERSGWK